MSASGHLQKFIIFSLDNRGLIGQDPVIMMTPAFEVPPSG